jgi:hypothetical protein
LDVALLVDGQVECHSAVLPSRAYEDRKNL